MVFSVRSLVQKGKTGLASLALVGALSGCVSPASRVSSSSIASLSLDDMVVASFAPAFRQEDYATLLASRPSRAPLSVSSTLAPELATIFLYHPVTNALGTVRAVVEKQSTGVYLTPDGFLLTPAHAVVNTPASRAVALSFTSTGVPQVHPLVVHAYSRQGDVALCKVIDSSALPVRVPILRSESDMQGTALTGTPLHYIAHTLPSSVSLVPKIKSSPFSQIPFYLDVKTDGVVNVESTLDGLVPHVAPWHGKLDYTWLSHAPHHDASWKRSAHEKGVTTPFRGYASPGESGTPLYDGEGALAGIIVSGNDSVNAGGMISASVLRSFLERYQHRTK